MKRHTKYLGCLILFTVLGLTPVKAQQIDPTLAAAVIFQTEELKSAYKKRNKTQQALITTQGAVAVAMDRVHAVEATILEYMSNASSAMEDLYQLKKAAELVGVNIPAQMKKMVSAVPQNWEGTAVTALTSKTCTDVATEMASLYAFMANLVTNSKFTFNDGSKSTSTKKNVNLLSAAERYYIATEVVGKLQKIYRKLWLITWQIENLGWEDAWRNIDAKSWAQAQYGKSISERLVKQWQKAKPFK